MIDDTVAELMKSIEDQGSDLHQLHMDVAYVNEKVIGLENKIALMKKPPFKSVPRNATAASTLPSAVHTEMNQRPTIISRGMTTTANPQVNYTFDKGTTLTTEPQTTTSMGMVMTHPVCHLQVYQAISHQVGQPTTQAMPQTNPAMPAFPPL